MSFELLKQFPDLTKEGMVWMIDRMLRRGMVPEGWERSATVMLLKNDPLSSNAKDFRPVALLSHCRKLLEPCLSEELARQMMNKAIIAYRRKMRTELALILYAGAATTKCRSEGHMPRP